MTLKMMEESDHPQIEMQNVCQKKKARQCFKNTSNGWGGKSAARSAPTYAGVACGQRERCGFRLWGKRAARSTTVSFLVLYLSSLLCDVQQSDVPSVFWSHDAAAVACSTRTPPPSSAFAVGKCCESETCPWEWLWEGISHVGKDRQKLVRRHTTETAVGSCVKTWRERSSLYLRHNGFVFFLYALAKWSLFRCPEWNRVKENKQIVLKTKCNRYMKCFKTPQIGEESNQ